METKCNDNEMEWADGWVDEGVEDDVAICSMFKTDDGNRKNIINL